MRAAVKKVAEYFPTAIISGRRRDKVVGEFHETIFFFSFTFYLHLHIRGFGCLSLVLTFDFNLYFIPIGSGI